MANNRGRVFFAFLFFISLLYFFVLIDLQVIKHERYLGFAEENAARITPLRAPRGIIYDRRGEVVVQNRPVFSLFFFKDQVEPAAVDKVLALLSQKIGVPFGELKEKASSSSYLPYEGIKIAQSLSSDMVSKIKESAQDLPGVRVLLSPLREYPHKNIGIHLLGYIGEISKKELEELEPYGYRLGDLVGKDGLEKQYDKYLHGVAGGEKTEVDAFGRPIRLVESLDPISGNNLRLTIDQEMQTAVDGILGNRNGAVVVLDPNSGEILAMVSHPSYDPTKEWDEINQSNHPFMNRALSPVPPGSIFKPVVLQAAIDGYKITAAEQITCNGFINLGKRLARCWRVQGHHRITFIEALVWSCDVAFYELGLRLGPDKISEWAEQFGLGKQTEIDLPGEKRGIVPSQSWKERVFKQGWFNGDTINYAIGQGFLLVTPLQMASLYGEIATGKRFKPYVVSEVISSDKKVVFSQKPVEVFRREISQGIRQALREVIRRGTGIAANVPGLPAAGKTGTAENPGRPHAWFVAYAPYDKPEIVVSVFVEHGEHGDQAPARMTGEILRWYKKYRLKRRITPEEPVRQYIDHAGYKEWIHPFKPMVSGSVEGARENL